MHRQFSAPKDHVNREHRPDRIAKFGDYRFDPHHLELRKFHARVRMETKPAQVLALLLSRPGELVTRQELRLALWPDNVHVNFEAGLDKSIHKLRSVLSDESLNPRFIERISGRGYRFIAPVELISPIGNPEELPKPARVEEPRIEEEPQNTGSADPLKATIPVAPAPFLSSSAISPFLPLAGLILVVLALAAGAYYSDLRWKMLMKPARRSAMILGFRNLSADSSESWLSTAFAEWLWTDLSFGGQLRLIPEGEVARARSELGITQAAPLSPDQLSRIRGRFNADLVISGSYAALGPGESGQIRLDLSVQNTADGETLSTDSFVGRRDHLLGVATEAGTRLRGALKLPALSAPGIEGVRAALPVNPDASRLYSEGLAQLRTLNAGKAEELLSAAVLLEPSHGLTHFALAQAWSLLGHGDKARAESKQAFELSTSLPKEQRILIQGQYHEAMQDWNAAVEDYASLFRFHSDEIEYGLKLASSQISASRASSALDTLALLRHLPSPQRDDPRIDLTEADAAEALSDFHRQLQSARDAVEKSQRNGMNLLVAQAQLSEGKALRSLGEIQSALDIWNAAEKTFGAAGDQSGVARTLNSQAFALRILNKGEEAVEHYERAIDISRAIQDSSSLADGLAGLGHFLIYQDQPVRTRKLLQEAVAIYSETANQKEQAFAISLLGDLEMVYNHSSRARELYEQSLLLSRQVSDKSRVAGRLMDLGIIDTNQGNLLQASEKLGESLRIYRELGEKVRISSVLNRSALVEIYQGDLEAARKDLEESISLREEIGDRSGVWQPRIDLARDLLEMGEAGKAESVARQSLAEHSYNSEALSWIVLARALLAEGKLAESKDAYRHALNHPAHFSGGVFEVDLDLHHSKLLAAQGNFPVAERELRKAAVLARNLGWVSEEMKVRLAQGELELLRGESAKGYRILRALQRDAGESGFGLFAAKARVAVASSGSTPLEGKSGGNELGNR
jgi:DNA-binding winged helix-turn-helix (wHTH) protein/tetratricopeptide (TPR) repeat protein